MDFMFACLFAQPVKESDVICIKICTGQAPEY
jgi:hypothetical protein